MSELKSRFCWRCLFFALAPLLALFAVTWGAMSSAYSERATVAESTGGLVEQLADLDSANADLRRELATTREALQAARGAALATGSGGSDDIAARIASLPERERFALLDQAGATVFGPDQLMDRLTRMPQSAQSQVFEALPSMQGFQDWYESLGKDEQREWLSRLPGGAQPIRYNSSGQENLLREVRLPGASSGCDCTVEASGPNKLLQSVQLLTPSERAVFFPALAEAVALPEWFGAATPGERVEFVNALPDVELVDIRVQSNKPMAPISLAEALEREAGLTARLEASDMALRATKARAQGETGADASLNELQTALSRAEVARDEAAARTRQVRAELLKAQRDLQAAARARSANESALREARGAVARVEAEKNLAATAIAQLETRIETLNQERVRLVNALETASPSVGPTRLAQADGGSTGASNSGGDLRARLSEATEEVSALRAERTRLIARLEAVEGSAADALESLRRQREATSSARVERDAALTRSEDAEKAAQAARAALEALRTQSADRIARLEANAQGSGQTNDEALRARIAQLEGALKAAETGAEAQRRAAAAAAERTRTEIDRLKAQLEQSRKAAEAASTGGDRTAALRQEIARLEGAVKAAEAAAEAQRRSAAAALDRARSDVSRLEGELKAAQTATESQRRAAAAALTAHESEKARLTEELDALRNGASSGAAPNAGSAAMLKSLEAQLAALRAENARLGGDLERIARERDAIIEETTQRIRRSQQRVGGLETEVVRLNAELARLEETEAVTGDEATLRTLKAENAGLDAANRRLTAERDGARQATKERESALNTQIETLRGANRELSRKLSEAAVRIAGIGAAGGDDEQAASVLLRQLEADKNGLTAQIDRLTQQMTGMREASSVREEALKSRITAATRARQAMQVERDMAIEAARRLAASAEDGAKPPANAETADTGDAALRAERDAAVALALRLQAEVERGVRTLMIEGRGAMTAGAVASTIRALESDQARLRAALDDARNARDTNQADSGADPQALRAAIERAERAELALSRARQGLDALALAEQERDAEKERAEAALKRARDGLDALSIAKREQDAALERATRAEAALDRAREGLDRLTKAESERNAAVERAERAETALDRARGGLDSLTSAQRERDDAVARAERAEAALREARAELASAPAGRSGDAATASGGDAALAAMRTARDAAVTERDRARADLADARQGFARASAEVEGLKAELERSQRALNVAAPATAANGAAPANDNGVKLVDRPDLAVDGDVILLRRQIAALESALARVGDRDRDEAEKRGAIVERLRVTIGATETASLSLPVGPLVTPPLRLDGALVFEPGDATVSAKGKAKLAELATELKRELAAQPDRPWRLAIEGHTDRRPISTAEFPSNWTLSAARAAAVAKVLEDLGVPSRRLLAIGRAEYDPIDPANTAEAYALNRRIEFDIVSH